MDDGLQRLGQNLWRSLIPDDFKAIYAQERREWQNCSLIIVSDEPTVPWELLWPYEAGQWEDADPWCLTLRLTRWLRRTPQGNSNDRPAYALPLQALAVLAPINPALVALPAAQTERTWLLSLAQQQSIQDVSPPRPVWSEVRQLLEKTDYDWFQWQG